MDNRQNYLETDRLILRELLPSDDKDMYVLDSDPEVHKYLGGNPVNTIGQSRQMINLIRKQYVENGIGRWAVLEKQTGNFMGWAGLKRIKENINGHSDFYELGYRLIPRYWGKGYATEASKAWIEYGFNRLGLKVIYGMTACDNLASQKVLKKAGFKFIEIFDLNGMLHNWYKIEK